MNEDRASYDAFVRFLSTPLRDGKPFVLETRHAISLHFDHLATQSFMSLKDPSALALGYTRVMMGFLLLQPAPAHICMLGLGGGSLAKYCYRHLPDTAIDAVEINPDVIALRDVFRIPADDARFRVVCADGADHVARADVRTDVILHDAFAADGMPGRCTDRAFFAACRERLSDAGVLAINFTDDDPALPEHIERLRSVFGASCSLVRCGDDSNFVAFAWNGDRRLPSMRVLIERAMSFGFAGDLKLMSIARRLKAGECIDPAQLTWRDQGQARWEIGA
ncbi:fused MFS/spermidine synthase [Burkholderia pseudomultivorans]|uniref:Polyamine aminopropyltransferase n=1 Tax=Burkholderia pseudomultivorans TaxID=1207504 RepID=A0ABU2E2H2_9BURK|nr:fused MFS/spermidine synthase [Burkholderia pseudomultivorans]MDR8727561.1 Polyamine aminopropyltransferase [Burkholderia pseudomultivorans]MDR8736569.1 Polyamine aminopropyltransferase [Burkholderia pseudomultivorans]MDR8740507.1 Polyamine aminopropyltransferase [Burkholderia pseudomultivorans]MDR8754044.1 Polyamine aminopropyltransferase [Burkholderia pseudomultivorans]MDR8776921.1 Polyamine aminopropyltransferase [Burkholderia pseudomultivorans]